MSPSTVAERKRELFKLLNDKEVPRIVLFGESGVGKTWTAREMSLLAKNKGVIDIALWVFLNRQHDRASLCDSMAHQLSLLATTPEAEVEDKNKESEKPRDLQHQIAATVAGKKLLLVLDDEGNKMSEQEIMSELKTLLNVNLRNHKVLITKRSNSEEIIGSKIEVKPLSKDESLSLLQKHVRTGVYGVPGIKALAEALFEKTENLTKNFPAAIVLLAKAFNYFAQQDNGLQKLKAFSGGSIWQ
ncbi:putative disease resistance protein [Camellia lanceoleosa]|uniref:Disease resistance protein n=1 Tax=Camellia lanceoleosa TaxID=1840588 RepID=A0ACC0GFV5_9ERIC|nr:putative disease resistance protein [Camellia lanceoleosa]